MPVTIGTRGSSSHRFPGWRRLITCARQTADFCGTRDLRAPSFRMEGRTGPLLPAGSDLPAVDRLRVVEHMVADRALLVDDWVVHREGAGIAPVPVQRPRLLDRGRAARLEQEAGRAQHGAGHRD